MLTEKQKEAIKVILEIYRKGELTDDQVITMFEGFTYNNQTVQHIPEYFWTTYKGQFNPETQIWEHTSTSNKQEI
jgi:hypothetical protein